MKWVKCIAGAVIACLSVAPARAEAPASPADWVRLAVAELCRAEPVSSLAAQQALPGAWFLNEDREERGGTFMRISRRFALPGDDELRTVRIQTGDQIRRFTAAVYEVAGDKTLPLIQGTAHGACRLDAGRRIVRDEDGPEVALEQLEGDLETVKWTETLQAPWPEGTDPGGPRVALVDSGLAYDLPLYRDRLARDPDGKPFGYDFWESDPWPYDGDVSRGAFFPIRHGSAVASVLAREAPSAALIPYRYPRPDMDRMRVLVRRAAEAGARILAMPLGSNDREDWTGFEAAMRDHPELLAIVSAGNNGRNIDESPLWPAVLDLDNLVVVTSSDGFGKLATGSNWGPENVDIMLPAENVTVVDFRGAKGTASGSSYAVPRLAALAARLLATDPELSAKELKARIFARAKPSPYEDEVVAVGWIPDPAGD
ncbi:MAG: S8 family serine peptidase [Dichotomicrobium sp.]